MVETLVINAVEAVVQPCPPQPSIDLYWEVAPSGVYRWERTNSRDQMIVGVVGASTKGWQADHLLFGGAMENPSDNQTALPRITMRLVADHIIIKLQYSAFVALRVTLAKIAVDSIFANRDYMITSTKSSRGCSQLHICNAPLLRRVEEVAQLLACV